MNIFQLINFASNTKQTMFLMQQPTDDRAAFPFGDSDAIAAHLTAGGASVTCRDANLMLVDNSAWLSIHGVATPRKESNL